MWAADVQVADESGNLFDYQNQWKRAVKSQPPPQFSLSLLPPNKLGSSTHYYGVRITALDDYNPRASVSTRSVAAPKEYDIWRRWEDWIGLQETLAVEYDQRARQKRHDLQAGKGLMNAKDGIYKNADSASSWESLPFGPDPKSVAKDFYKLVPMMPTRGVFRVTQAVLDTRIAALKAFIEALFGEDQPTLIQDMRGDRMVTDFFGVWRRDLDLQRKEAKRVSNEYRAPSTKSPRSSRSSMASSLFGTYFANATTPSIDSQPTSPKKSEPFSAPVTEHLSASRLSMMSSMHAKSHLPSLPLDVPIIITTERHHERKRRSSVSSDSESSSSASPRSSTSSTGQDRPKIAFAHLPMSEPRGKPTTLTALPEDEEMKDRGNGALSQSLDHAQRFAAPGSRRARLSAQLISSQSLDLTQAMRGLQINELPNRESWQSGMSAIDDMGILLPPEKRFSTNSYASFMTQDSAEGVLPFDDREGPESPHMRKDDRTHSVWTAGSDPLENYYFSDIAPRRDSAQTIFDDAEDGDYALARPASSQTMRLSNLDFILPDLVDDTDHEQSIEYSPPACDGPELPMTARPMSLALSPAAPDFEQSIEYTRPTFGGLEVPMTARPHAFPPSPTTSTFSTATNLTGTTLAPTLPSVSTLFGTNNLEKTLSPTAPVTIKAALGKTIIVFRATRDIPLSDARQKLRDKFRMQEKIVLSRDFVLALATQESNRSRFSVLSIKSEPELRLINTVEEWRWVMGHIDHGKITIHILDDDASTTAA